MQLDRFRASLKKKAELEYCPRTQPVSEEEESDGEIKRGREPVKELPVLQGRLTGAPIPLTILHEIYDRL